MANDGRTDHFKGGMTMESPCTRSNIFVLGLLTASVEISFKSTSMKAVYIKGHDYLLSCIDGPTIADSFDLRLYIDLRFLTIVKKIIFAQCFY
jgi:hypothetical protein